MADSEQQAGEATFIEPWSVEALQGRLLFYPCAGNDWSEFLDHFNNYIEEFHFCDEPLSNLYNKLSKKLSDQALIVSDGSNVRRRVLRGFHRKSVSGAEAYDALREQGFTFGEFRWRCAGYMGSCGGSPTLVWHVARL